MVGVIVALVLLGGLWLVAKVVWTSGFLSGRRHEAFLWLDSIDKLIVPNWQSMELSDSSLTKEEAVFANKVYAAAYRAALDHIKLDISIIQQVEIEKAEEPTYPI